MSHRVIAFYHDREKARLAVGDLQSSGVPSGKIVFGLGLAEGTGRIEIEAVDYDQAVDVESFLRLDGAYSIEVRPGTEVTILDDTVPTVPALD